MFLSADAIMQTVMVGLALAQADGIDSVLSGRFLIDLGESAALEEE